MTAKSTKSKTNRKNRYDFKKSTSNKKQQRKIQKTTRSTRTAKSGNSFLMDEILIWITLAVSIILLISNFGVAGFLEMPYPEFCGRYSGPWPISFHSFCLVWYLFRCLIKAIGMLT